MERRARFNSNPDVLTGTTSAAASGGSAGVAASPGSALSLDLGGSDDLARLSPDAIAAALAGAYFRADLANQARILQAFGELFAEYRDQAVGIPEFRRDTWAD